jgi:catechol 2,3-dioxygenase-like lactoylglutathione lyase family enzyme
MCVSRAAKRTMGPRFPMDRYAGSTRRQTRITFRFRIATQPDRESAMKPAISVLTLGVDDLDAAVTFYRDGLGLPTQGIVGTEFEHGAVAFFDFQSGLKLALFERGNIAHDAGLPLTARSATEFTIGHNVSSEREVDDVMRQALAAGARLVKPAGATFWGGYSGYFQDPDGHLWEIVFNPALMPGD